MAGDLDCAKSLESEPEKWAGEQQVVDCLRRGEESAFVSLISRYHTLMVRVAMMYVADQATAEEIVQDTWIGVLEGIDRFEGRSSIKTWIFKILTNKARTRGAQENRGLAFLSLETIEGTDEPAVDPERFRPADDPQMPDSWANPPIPWAGAPEAHALNQEILRTLRDAIDTLPPRQRSILLLHDIEGWASHEICNVFNLTETNHRVLLHRARSKVRQALECYFKD
jgi:RNA polymerase sigma-70 factor (ECF subfamily)